jgi:hypothetical protein
MADRRRGSTLVATIVVSAAVLAAVTVLLGAGMAALLLLGAWAGRLTAHCMALPFRDGPAGAARTPSG